MAVRSAQLQDLNYVPNYNTLNTDLVNTVDSQIQAQSARNQAFAMDTLGELQENVTSGLSNLDVRDQQYAQDVVNETRNKIDERFSTQGTRGSLSFIQREAQNFQNKLQPHFKYSATQKQVQEELAESEAPAFFKNSIDFGKIEYDEEGKATYAGMDKEAQRRLSITANYKDPYKKLQEFNSKARKASGTEDAMFSPVTDSQGNVIVNSEGQPTSEYRQKLKSIGFDSVMQDNIAVLLADPQIRSQLELKGQLLLEQAEAEGIETNISVGENGSVTTVLGVPKRSMDGSTYIDEDGNPTNDKDKAALVNEERQFDSLAHLMAAKEAQPFAMRDSFIDRSFDVRSNTETSTNGRNNNNYNANIGLPTKVDFEIESQGAREFFTNHFGTKQQLKQTNEQISDEVVSAVQRQMPDSRVDISSSDEGHTLVHINGEKFDIRDPESREKLKSNLGVSYDSVMTQLQDVSDNYKRVQHLERTEKDIVNYVRNNISKDSNLGQYENFLVFGDEGSIQLDEEFISEQVRTGKLNRKEINASVLSEGDIETLAQQYGVESQYDRFQGTEGNFTTSKARELLSKIPDGDFINLSKTTGARTTQESYIVQNGKLYSLEEPDSGEVSGIHNMLSKAKEHQQEIIDRYREVGIYETSGRILSSADDIDAQIIDDIRRIEPGRPGASGQLTDTSLIGGDGNPVEVDYTAGEYFDPLEIANIRGESSVIGVVRDSDENIVEDKENVRFTGTTAEGVMQKVLGDDFKDLIGIQQLSSYLHKPAQGERKNQLSTHQIGRIHGLPEESVPYKNGLTVDYRVSYRGDGPPVKKFYVTDPNTNKDIIEASSYEDLYWKLANKINEQI